VKLFGKTNQKEKGPAYQLTKGKAGFLLAVILQPV